uniref:Uncharacterized protein n=1 Tax=Arundo donax TaxID=35708 RepID=A0A0A9B7Z3_ARUDO
MRNYSYITVQLNELLHYTDLPAILKLRE